MYHSMKSGAVILMLAFVVSCSKKGHEPKPVCTFTGKTTLIENKGSLSLKSSSSTELDQDDPDFPRAYKRTYISERKDETTNTLIQRTTETLTYTFEYDTDRALKTLLYHRSYLFEGFGKAGYLHGNRRFTKFRLDDTDTFTYTYKAGSVSSVAIKAVNTIQGNNESPETTESQKTKVYQYDGSGKATSALTTYADGAVAETFVNGIIATSTQKDRNGTVISETKYNAMGLNSSITANDHVYEMKWDSKGNLSSVQLTQNGKVVYLHEFGYDDHENPENAIKKYFKGIPESITTVQLTDGVNNLINEKFTSFNGGSNNYNDYIYQYNANGLPESWTPKSARGGETMITTFRYKCP
jgi:YD repeat-containing protein